MRVMALQAERECSSHENASLGYQFNIIDKVAIAMLEAAWQFISIMLNLGALYSLKLEINFVIIVLFSIKSLATSLTSL